MEKIDNYNCDGLCIEKSCDKRYTHFTNRIINGVELHLSFCRKHANEYEETEEISLLGGALPGGLTGALPGILGEDNYAKENTQTN